MDAMSSRPGLTKKRGPKPQQSYLKLVRGDPGKRGTKNAEVPKADRKKPSPSRPKEPRWAELLPHHNDRKVRTDAKEKWKELVEALDRDGLLSMADGMLLEDAAICFARMRQCERQISTRGTIVWGTNGSVKKNPAVTMAHQYRTHFHKYVEALGLGYEARMERMSPDDDDDDGTIDD